MVGFENEIKLLKIQSIIPEALLAKINNDQINKLLEDSS